MTSHCVYFGDEQGERGSDKEIHSCHLHDRCVRDDPASKLVSCRDCNSRLRLGDEGFLDKWVDPLVVLDRRRKRTEALRDLLAGGDAFLAAGGPSADDLPLEELNRRGIWTMAVNNMAGHGSFRPQAMVCADPPGKFSHSIWLDPGIVKFVPMAKLRGVRARLRRKLPDGKFKRLDRETHQCPNVWGYKRCPWLTPDDDFFLADGAYWGNLDDGVRRTGQPKAVCTLLLGIRLLRYLGARRVFLVGVDFSMSSGRGYAFPQGGTREAAASNNEHFAVVNEWLCQMQKRGVFERFGISILNCYQNSSLRAFPHVPFDTAVEIVRGGVEDRPDLSGWYDPEK